MKGDGLFTADEVASMLKISKHTVYEMIKRGDLAAFRIGNQMRIESNEIEAYKRRMTTRPRRREAPAGEMLRLAGSHDFIIERLVRFLNRATPNLLLQVSTVGSLEGLMMLHRGLTDIAAIHLIDPANKEYNLPLIKRLFIHEPLSVIRLASRKQGFITAPDNPKGIRSWHDLRRRDVQLINRQKGSGTRFLLDAFLAEHGISPHEVTGYNIEEWSHIDTAAEVAQGHADVTLGIETAAHKFGLHFIPIITEPFDLVFVWREENREALSRFFTMLQSAKLKKYLEQYGGYDFRQLGKVIMEQNHTASESPIFSSERG